MLGRYEVGAKIGGGGMATVFVGRDIRDDGTEALVALKVIRDEFADDEQFMTMFADEAKLLARLSHPNVIQTLDFGVNGTHRFIAMELLNGRTLADVWDVLAGQQAKFELGLAAWICARVAEGLHSAHELVDEAGAPLSVIHRDVNPTNVFLTHSGEVKLIDFGLAKARVRAAKSVDGIVKGKIPYLAPEQAYGLPIDRRIDIYALGTTLWELSTMKRLFKRDTDVDTIKAIRDARIPDPRQENPDFPDALWKIIDRALRRERDERYASAEEMRLDLDAFARSRGPHVHKLATLISQLFPGGEARQAQWLRDAAAIAIDAPTMAPPAPVPIASSSLLDVDEVQSVRLPDLPDSARPSAAASEAIGNDTPKASGAAPDATHADASKATGPAKEKPTGRASVPPPSKRRGAKSKGRIGAGPESKRTTTRARDATSTTKRVKRAEPPPSPADAEPREDTKKLWLIVTTVVVLLFALALVASR